MKHDPCLWALCAAALISPASTDPATAQAFYQIDFARHSGPKTVSYGGVNVTLRALKDEDDPAAINVASSIHVPGYRTITLSEDSGSAPGFRRQVGIGKLSASDPAPSVLLQTFSGGAHCCSQLKAIVPVAGRLRIVRFEDQDGDGIRAFPVDVDHDGTVDFIFDDDRFQYAFASHAGSWTPPRIFNVANGKRIDVSTRPAFAPLFRRFASKTKAHCANARDVDRNGACAAYVAAEARLGRFEAALKEADRLADHSPRAWLPTGCRVETAQKECPKGKELEFRTFSAALRWFLRKNGYLS